MGYHRAGFDVVGVDIEDQPRYPFEFSQEDALGVFGALAPYASVYYDAIHASPPCQFGSKTQRINGREHLNLIAAVREMLEETALPYVIENVPASFRWLRNPIRLEGQAFGLNTHRPRLFETNWPLEAPPLIPPPPRQAKMGRRPRPGEAIQVVGNFTDVEAARRAMGIDWMTRDELSQAIPPAMTEYIGHYLLAEIDARKAVA